MPGNDIQCLLAASDGSLWVGTSEGLARWKDGDVATFTAREGLAGNDVRAVVESANHVVWAWTGQGLARLAGDHFVDGTDGTLFPAGTISAVTSNGQGELWVTSGEDMSVYRDGRWAHAHMTPPVEGGSITWARAFQGYLAVASKSGLQVLVDGALAAHFSVGRELRERASRRSCSTGRARCGSARTAGWRAGQGANWIGCR